MINKLFESLSSAATFTSSTPKKNVNSLPQLLLEIFSKVSEAILQMRFDRSNLKQFSAKLDSNCKYLQVSLKKLYKTQDFLLEKLNYKNKNEMFIEFYFQNKKDGSRQLIERWTLSGEINYLQNNSLIAPEKAIGKAAIFMRSLLCLLCATPLWKLYKKRNQLVNNLLKKTFLDYSLFFELNKKNKFESKTNGIKEKNIHLEIPGEILLDLKLEYLEDFSYFLIPIQNKLMEGHEKQSKRQRFLSETIVNAFENNLKSENSTNDSGVNNSGIQRWDSDNYLSNQKLPIDDKMNPNEYILAKNKKKAGKKHRNLMSRKDSLILQSNNQKKNSIKVVDDEGEEIEIEYVCDKLRNEEDFIMQTIKEDNEICSKEKTIFDFGYDNDNEYVVMKLSERSDSAETIINKIKQMKNYHEKIKKNEKPKNLKEEMDEITKFYLSLVQEDKIAN